MDCGIGMCPWDERTPVIHSPCFFQAQLQMLSDSHTFGWPSFWLLQCAYCPWLPSVSCQWPFGHQKVIRYRKNSSSPNWESLTEIKTSISPKQLSCKRLGSWEIWCELLWLPTFFNSILQISPWGLSFLLAGLLLQKLSNIKRENSIEPPHIDPLNLTIMLLTFCHANSLGFFPFIYVKSCSRILGDTNNRKL